MSLLFFALLNVNSFIIPPKSIDTEDKPCETVLYEAETDCTYYLDGAILECVSTEKKTGKQARTVCTFDKSNQKVPLCIDIEILQE